MRLCQVPCSWLFVFVFSLIAWVAPKPASAQYKNTEFALDVGGWLITKPPLIDAKTGEVFANPDNRPLRLANGFRIGGESSFKMLQDHIWFVPRLNVSFLRYGRNSNRQAPEYEYDKAAEDALGTLFGLQGALGIRYVILTDLIRPYIQASVSYLRLFTFSSQSDSTCLAADFCGVDTTNSSNFLPHPNVGGVHLEPGVEFILKRDFALRVFVDLQRWLIFNAADNHSIVVGLGVGFFT